MRSHPGLTLNAFVVLCLAHFGAFSQQIGIDTAQISSLIHQWNFANNTRSLESFRNVYGDRLLFYTEQLDEDAAIAKKEVLFETRPGFKQTIASAISFTPYTSGVIKCSFTKEVWERSRWREYSSYLLVSYENSGYQIVGESDVATDSTLKYQLSIGEPMAFSDVRFSEPDRDKSESALDTFSLSIDGDSIEKAISSQFEHLATSLSEMGVVTIPKAYVFILIGLLGAGAMMIFIADIVQSRRKRRKRKGSVLRKRDEADQLIAEFNAQSIFESFVVTLFDPLFFQHRRPAAERVYAGKVSEGESGADLEFDYRNKEAQARFAIKCLYFNHVTSRDLQLFPRERRGAYKNFDEENDMPLYFVIGLGGTPDDPKELYLVPSKAVRGNYVARESLKPYVKSGMFYFNRTAGRLQ